jgi:peptide/nickel transport system permease protein
MWGASGKRAFLEPVMTVAGMIPELIVAGALLWLAVSAHASLNQAWLPALALWFSIVPIVFLHAYGAFRSAFGETFVRLAESRGIPRARLWTKFVLPAAASPLLSLLGPSFAAAVGSSLAIEAVTGWPGLGQLFVEAVQSRDFEVVQAVVMLLAVTLTFLNLAADLILYRADLRIRLSYDRPR